DTDIAMIVTQMPKGVAPVTLEPPRLEDGPWVAAGFRGGVMRVQSVPSIEYRSGLIRAPKPAVGGMSGGPLFNVRGSVVAVVVASDRSSEMYAATAPIGDMIREFQRKD